jgi:hypothetical protein
MLAQHFPLTQHLPLAQLAGIALVAVTMAVAVLIASRLRVKFVPAGEHDAEQTRAGIRARMLRTGLWVLCLILFIFGVKAALTNPHWPSPLWLVVSALLASSAVFGANLRVTGRVLWDAVLLGVGATGLGMLMAMGLPEFFWKVCWPLLKWLLVLGVILWLLAGFAKGAGSPQRD